MLNTINDLWKSGEFIANYLKMGLRYYPTLVGAKEGPTPDFYVGVAGILFTGAAAVGFGKKAVLIARQDFYNNKRSVAMYATLSAVSVTVMGSLMLYQSLKLFCQGAIVWGQAMDMGYIPTNVRNSPCGKLLGLSD